MTNWQKVAVLGANSFSGQDFCDLLLQDTTCEVLGVSRSPLRSPVFINPRLRESAGRFRYWQLDLNRDFEELLQLLDRERPDAIVNFAAQSEVAPSWEQPEQWLETNCVSLARIVNHLRRRDYLRRFVQISSPEAYGHCRGTIREDAPLNPSTPYAVSKAAADMLLEAYRRHADFPLLTVRATNVYGRGQQLHKIIPRSVIYLRLGRTISLHGGGAAVKSYIHIRDVSRGELAVLRQGEPGAIYHLSPDHGVAIHELVRMICRQMGKDFDEATEAVGERLGQDAAYVIDSTRARRQLDWRPQVALEEGLDEVVRWIGEQWEQVRQLPLEYQHQP